MRIVLDTSVIVAAMRSSSGVSAKLVEMALDGEFELLLSVPLLLEYEAVLTVPPTDGFGIQPSANDIFLDRIRDRSVAVHLGYYWPVSAKDEDDSHVLTLAVAGQADGLVTHDVEISPEKLKARA